MGARIDHMFCCLSPRCLIDRDFFLLALLSCFSTGSAWQLAFDSLDRLSRSTTCLAFNSSSSSSFIRNVFTVAWQTSNRHGCHQAVRWQAAEGRRETLCLFPSSIESNHQVTLISGLNEFMVKFPGPSESNLPAAIPRTHVHFSSSALRRRCVEHSCRST